MKMTVKKGLIKKALEICAQTDRDCTKCPYYTVKPCIRTLCNDALSCICDLEKKISHRDAALKMQRDFLCDKIDEAYKLGCKQKESC